MSLQSSKEFDLKNYFVFFLFVALLLTLTIWAFISFLIYVPIFLLSFLFPKYGKFLSYYDTTFDEDIVNFVPQNTLVYTLTIDGNLSLEELRSTFAKNVLEARSKMYPEKLRYSKLQQYITTFICFRIWKADPNFQIENHIVEEYIPFNEMDKTIQNIHEVYMNQKFANRRSPWEVTLIRNLSPTGDNSNENPNKSLVVLKISHVLADARSVTKLLVESLGKSTLKTATPQILQNETIWIQMKFVLMYPINFFREQFKIWSLSIPSYSHPWKMPGFTGSRDNEKVKTVVAFSENFCMSDIKKVAKIHHVTTSAIIINIVAEISKKYCRNLERSEWNKNIAVAYTLPKADHPEYFTNHLYFGVLNLPLEEDSMFKRLQQCNQNFVRMKVVHQYRYTNAITFLVGMLVHPLSRFVFNTLAPTSITNNAGSEEAFSIGTHECTDIHMTVGTLHGVIGVAFCLLSYKDGIRVAVVGKDSVVSRKNAEDLAHQFGKELKFLMQDQK